MDYSKWSAQISTVGMQLPSCEICSKEECKDTNALKESIEDTITLKEEYDCYEIPELEEFNT